MLQANEWQIGNVGASVLGLPALGSSTLGEKYVTA